MFRSSSTSAMVLPTRRSFCCAGDVRNGCPGVPLITAESPLSLWHLLGRNPASGEQNSGLARGFNPTPPGGGAGVKGSVAAHVPAAKIGAMAQPGSGRAAAPRAESPAWRARAVMRASDRAALATSQAGWPFASLVLVALDHDASPLLLISDLSEHAKNIKADRRESLLF